MLRSPGLRPRAVVAGLGIGLLSATAAAPAQTPAPSGTVFTIAGNGTAVCSPA